MESLLLFQERELRPHFIQPEAQALGAKPESLDVVAFQRALHHPGADRLPSILFQTIEELGRNRAQDLGRVQT